MKVRAHLTAIALATVATAMAVGSGAALAQLGQPEPWQMDLQQAATPIMEKIASFHYMLLWITGVITAFVLALLLIVIVRFNARANPTPSRTTHNTPIEVLWTIVPVIILATIAVPSFRLLFTEFDMPQARPHHQGDRQAVVLELQLSGQRISNSTC